MSEFPVITRYEVVGAEDVMRTNAELWNSFKQGGVQVNDFNVALRENMEGTYAMRRAYSGIRMAVRVEWAAVLETSRAMMAVGRIGRDVLQMWQAYTLGQYRVEQAAKGVATAEEDVAKWQFLYNQYLRDFGSESAYTKNAYENLAAAQKQLQSAQETSMKALSDMWVGYLGMGLTSFGIVASSIDLMYHVKVLKAITGANEELGGFAAAWGAGIAIPVTLAIVGSIAIEEYLKELTKEPATTAPAGIQAVWSAIPVTQRQGMKLQENLQNIWDWLTGGGSQASPATELPPILQQVPHGQLGIDYIPQNMLIYAHKGERLLNPERTRQDRLSLTRPIIAKVTQHNIITKTADAERAADAAYQKILKKLGDKT